MGISKFIGLNRDYVTRAIFYIWRADEKGRAVEDLEKAKWYLEREIEKRKKSEKPKPSSSNTAEERP